MTPQREVLERQKADYQEKARHLKAYINELTNTVAKCGTDSSLLEADLTHAKNDAQFYEEEMERLDAEIGSEATQPSALTSAHTSPHIVAQASAPTSAETSNATYWVQEDSAGEWRWQLRAGNNRIIADSGQGYREKQDCLHGIALVKDSKDAPIKEKGKH